MINIKRILCPTDLSPHSENAVRYALALARAHEAELIFFHCTPDGDGEEKLRASVAEHVGSSAARLIVAAADDIGVDSLTSMGQLLAHRTGHLSRNGRTDRASRSRDIRPAWTA